MTGAGTEDDATRVAREDVVTARVVGGVAAGLVVALGWFAVVEARRAPVGGGSPAVGAVKAVSVDRGEELYLGTCALCHGAHAGGVDGQGVSLRASAFVAGATDEQLVQFIKMGRPKFHPDNVTGIDMPPRGGNLELSDGELREIVGYVRRVREGLSASGGEVGGR